MGLGEGLGVRAMLIVVGLALTIALAAFGLLIACTAE
jgi:hypothetical protein